MENSRSEGITVVIVEDHPLYADSVRIALERSKQFRVVGVAGNHDQAVDLIAQEQPDLAVIDVLLPGSVGTDVARQARELSPKTKIVMLTGSDDPKHAAAVIPLGVAGYLPKAIQLLGLAPAVLAAYQGSRVFSETAMSVLSVNRAPTPCPLSEHELRLLRLRSEGKEIEEMAAETASSRPEVNRDLKEIRMRLGVATTVEAVVLAVRNEWI